MRPFDWRGMWAPRWPPWEVALRAAIVYLSLQLLLRLVGRKELARYSTINASVLIIISIALRETIVGDDTSITSGIVALATIIGLDWLLSYLSFRSERAADIIEGPVRQLVKGGVPVERAMRRSRVSRAQLLAELRRQHGRGSLAEVADAFLERSGHVSFTLREGAAPPSPPSSRR